MRSALIRMGREHGGPLLTTAALIAFVVWSWSGLWVNPPARVILLAALCAAVPAVVSLIPHRLGGLLTLVSGAGGGVLILAAATDASLRRLLRLDREAWTAVGAMIDDGITGAASIAIPLPDAPGSQAVSATLVVLAAMSVFLITSIGVVTRRPLAAVVTAGVALAYRWTLAPPERPLLTGVVAATLVVAMFLYARPGRRRQANASVVALGAGLVLVAAVVSIGADASARWDWRSWSWGDDARSTTVLSLEQSYGPLEYPDEEIEMLRVKADQPMHLRAVTLEFFDGSAFTTSNSLSEPVALIDGSARIPSSIAGKVRRSDVSLTGTTSPWLFQPGRVTEVAGLPGQRLERFSDDSLRVEPSLGRGASYTVVSVTPDPGPQRLLDVSADDLAVRSELPPLIVDDQAQPVGDIPRFGEGALPPSAFGRYAQVAELSREIIGSAATQYEAVNRIEAYLRRTYSYDTSVPAAASPDQEIQEFLFARRSGYCQHFANTMTLMLRMNGIDARVAVGLNVSGLRYDATSETYRVVDRDAHSWVEVDFGPKYGWLSFDPTPGRSIVANSASVTSPNYTLDDTPNAPPTLTPEPVDPAPQLPETPTPPAAESPVSTNDGRSWWLLALLVAITLVVGAPVAIKTARRRVRRRGGERDRVLGAARELESWLVDVGVPVDPAATPSERAEHVRRTLGIDAAGIYGLAAQARFAPVAPEQGSGAAAWRALAVAKRGVDRGTRLRAELRPRSLLRVSTYEPEDA